MLSTKSNANIPVIRQFSQSIVVFITIQANLFTKHPVEYVSTYLAWILCFVI
jgi:hypothetical protein